MRHFEAALDTVEKTRSDLMRTDYKLSYLTRLIDFYRDYVDALVDQGQIERALEVADSSRGRVLAERQGVSAPSACSAGLAHARGRVGHGLPLVLAGALAIVRVDRDAGARADLPLPPASEIEALVRQHQAAIDNVMADPLTAVGTRRRSAVSAACGAGAAVDPARQPRC